MKQPYPIHALNLSAATEKLLWHQKIVHPCYQYLYNSHKYIYGVPNFSNATSKVLDQCPTCIQAKMSKTSPGHGTTRVDTQQYQGLSIDFYFSGMIYDDSDLNTIYEVINGETWWIFITYHFLE